MLIIMLKNHSITLYIIKREKQNFNRVFEKNAVFLKKNGKFDIAKTSLLPFLVFAKHCVSPFVTNETKTAKKCFRKAVKYIKKRKITPFLQFYKRFNNFTNGVVRRKKQIPAMIIGNGQHFILKNAEKRKGLQSRKSFFAK